MLDINLLQCKQAQKVLFGKVMRTPLVPFDAQKTPLGNSIVLKAENLQPSGSFKIRGASYCLSLLSAEQKKAGIIAYSTGNHAQAVAKAARDLKIKATIVMSPEAPQFKIDGTRAYGATVIMAESSSQARRQMAEDLARIYGYYLVPPYDNIDVMTGQGTIGLEIIEEIQAGAIFVPIGGGGLIAGIAVAIKKSDPSIKIIGVEPEWENDAFQSFLTKKHCALPGPSASVADAIKVQTLGNLTYPLICTYVDDIVTVSENHIIEATLLCATQAHLLVEPAGALALAAALRYRGPLVTKKPVVCIASGGNMPLTTLCNWCCG